MTNEPSPRPWRVEPMFNGVADARGEKVAANIRGADARLIVDAVNRFERLRHVVRFLSECFTPEQKSVLRLVLAEARDAIGEGAP